MARATFYLRKLSPHVRVFMYKYHHNNDIIRILAYVLALHEQICKISSALAAVTIARSKIRIAKNTVSTFIILVDLAYRHRPHVNFAGVSF